MALAPGTRLGTYEVFALIGAGGMGEVYRARDTKLNRDVALKVLPEAFALDVDRLARFKREAQVLASLNHPHIAAIYGLEEANGSQFLVLELVEGETLAARLKAGPIPLTEALKVATQVADACQAAHEKGIVHRDLKPANVAFTADDQVKVLDFGLAKALEPSVPTDITNSPTLSLAATRAGVILGTAAYMSPEQAKGREADKRSDVWAFGAVLYEMLTGKRAFEGEDLSDTLAAVIMKDPDWTALPSNVPSTIRTLVQRCLEKDRKRRIADISTALFVIAEPGGLSSVGSIAPVQPAGWRRVSPLAVAGGAGAALVVVLMLWLPWRAAAPLSLVRVSAELGVDASLQTVNPNAMLALSPDGALLAFTAQKGGVSQLYVRRLGQLRAILLSDMTGARDPFFSPDGQWIAFFAGGKLKKISVTGGATVTLCDADSDRGGTWTEDHSIIFQGAGTGPLFRVSDTGGKPEPLTTLVDGEVTQRWPQVLPGGKAVLYTGHSNTAGFDDANLVVQPLPNGPRTVVQHGGYYGRYLASGHLVYIHSNTLFAVPFDLARLAPTGSPVPVLEGVAATANTGLSGAAAIAISEIGTVVYLPGQDAATGAPIQWLDSAGKARPLRAAPSNWSNPHFSPDGRRLAVQIDDGTHRSVWVDEWARDALTRLTIGAANDEKPVWTPDGRRIVFRSDRSGGGIFNLYWQRADGTGDVQRLTESKNVQVPASWDPRGKFLAFYETNSQTNTDLMILPMEGDDAVGWKPGKPTVFLRTPVNEFEPMFSPDGQWIAYVSNGSGRNEVEVRPFPGSGGSKWQISTEGGTYPTWSRARRELFFNTPDQHLMVASYTVEGDSFRTDKPRLWSDKRFELRPSGQRSVVLHPDGDRFALAVAAEGQVEAKQDKVVFIFNFFDELRRVAPVAKR